MRATTHEPVMRAEVIHHLLSGRSAAPLRIADLTCGAGGHAAALLEAAPAGSELLGIDRDSRARALAAERLAPFGGRVWLRAARFSQLQHEIGRLGWSHVDVLFADLGVSSMQIDEPDRGFSFRFDAPLDMRMDRECGGTAADLLAKISVEDLGSLLAELGELPRALRLARFLCREPRPRTTAELRARVVEAVGPSTRRHDPATLVFQALRIAVNEELAELEALLEGAPRVLVPGARFAVLSYHSLEDRRVKQAFARWTARCTCPVEQPICTCGGRAQAAKRTRGAERPGDEERLRNPRARSARLRAIEWLAESTRISSARRGQDGY